MILRDLNCLRNAIFDSKHSLAKQQNNKYTDLQNRIKFLLIEDLSQFAWAVCDKIAILKKFARPANVQFPQHPASQKSHLVSMILEEAERSRKRRAGQHPWAIILKLNDTDASTGNVFFTAEQDIKVVAFGIDF